MEKTAPIACEIHANAVVSKASDDEAHAEISLPESLQAPIEEGEKVGSVVYKTGGDVKSFDIFSVNAIPAASFPLVFQKVFNSLLSL